MSRLEMAVHYIVANTRPDELGKTKLAKVLFFADLDAFRRTGKPITEAVYVKDQHGPRPRQFYDAIENLERQRKIVQRQSQHFGYVQHQFFAVAEPDLGGLDAEDVAGLSVYTRAICENHTAASISDFTHNAAWELAEVGEEIPFAAFLAAAFQGRATKAELIQIEAALGA